MYFFKCTHLLKARKIDHHCFQIFSGGPLKKAKKCFLIFNLHCGLRLFVQLSRFCCVSRNWMTFCKYCLIFSIPAFFLKRFQDGEGLEMIWCTFQWSLQESIQMDSFWRSKLEIETCPNANFFLLWNVIYGFLPVLVMEVVCFITIHPKKSLHLFHCAFFLFLLFPPLLCQRRHHYYQHYHHDH